MNFDASVIGRTIRPVEFCPPPDKALSEDEQMKVLHMSELFAPGVWVDLYAIGDRAAPDYVARIRNGPSKGWTGTVYDNDIEIKHPLEFLATEGNE